MNPNRRAGPRARPSPVVPWLPLRGPKARAASSSCRAACLPACLPPLPTQRCDLVHDGRPAERDHAPSRGAQLGCFCHAPRAAASSAPFALRDSRCGGRVPRRGRNARHCGLRARGAGAVEGAPHGAAPHGGRTAWVGGVPGRAGARCASVGPRAAGGGERCPRSVGCVQGRLARWRALGRGPLHVNTRCVGVASSTELRRECLGSKAVREGRAQTPARRWVRLLPEERSSELKCRRRAVQHAPPLPREDGLRQARAHQACARATAHTHSRKQRWVGGAPLRRHPAEDPAGRSATAGGGALRRARGRRPQRPWGARWRGGGRRSRTCG